jgi:hypothetical protein
MRISVKYKHRHYGNTEAAKNFVAHISSRFLGKPHDEVTLKIDFASPMNGMADPWIASGDVLHFSLIMDRATAHDIATSLISHLDDPEISDVALQFPRPMA